MNHMARVADCISTHALTWSATVLLFIFVCFLAISTHALTWSATRRRIILMRREKFQLTHSRGVRRKKRHRIC